GGPPRERPLAHRRGEHARFDAVARRLDGDAHVRAVMRAHFAEIALLGHVLRARGVPLALLAEPVTPRFDALKPHLKHDYLAGVHALADRIGAPYWDLDAEVGLTTDEFWDPIHIGSDEARERFQTAFVARLAAFVLAERARGAPAADARGPGLDELGEPADDGAE
ncbi:MAG TPA: hypothetical protein VHB21_02795, partial [Minicystis sp.]|nr:hypothetical protein [Minicystis sp.]